MTTILLLDNYDSFTGNIMHYFLVLGATVHVFQNDRIEIEDVQRIQPSHIVIGPGPGSPQTAGKLLEVLRYCIENPIRDNVYLPILGICLGHQAIGAYFGATVNKAYSVQHGKRDYITCPTHPLFANLPERIQIGRYHSLMIENIPSPLQILARSIDNCVQAIAHERYPIMGVQFHPESILCPHGMDILRNFLQYSLYSK